MSQSFNEIREAAERGDAEAQYSLGFIYYRGTLQPKDEHEALRWFRAAAEQGYSRAQNYLAYMYYYGEGAEKNYLEAVRWYQAAAEQDIPAAWDMLGLIYGEVVRQLKRIENRKNDECADALSEQKTEETKYLEVIYHLMESNILNCCHAAYRVAADSEHENEDIYRINFYDKCRESAEHNHSEALFHQGKMYYEGEGETKDKDKGLLLIRKSAERGMLKAQLELLALAKSEELDGIEEDNILAKEAEKIVPEQESSVKKHDESQPPFDFTPAIRRLNEADVERFKKMTRYSYLVEDISREAKSAYDYNEIVAKLESKGIEYCRLQVEFCEKKVKESIEMIGWRIERKGESITRKGIYKEELSVLNRRFWQAYRAHKRYKDYERKEYYINLDVRMEELMATAATAMFKFSDFSSLYEMFGGSISFVRRYAKIQNSE